MAGYSYRLPRKYRYQRRAKLTDKQAVALVLVVIVAAGAASGHKAASKTVHHAGASLTSVLVPGGTDLNTPSGWARALLAAESDPVTSCDFNAVTEWERREGGGFGNQASFNPLNLNPGAGSDWPGYAVIGAWAFPDAVTGLQYTVQVLSQRNFVGIREALAAGNNAQAVCNAIQDSDWAASHYGYTMTATC